MSHLPLKVNRLSAIIGHLSINTRAFLENAASYRPKNLQPCSYDFCLCEEREIMRAVTCRLMSILRDRLSISKSTDNMNRKVI
jgi:hypothetical protein